MARRHLDHAVLLTRQHGCRDGGAAGDRRHGIAQVDLDGLLLHDLGDRSPDARDLTRAADHQHGVHVQGRHTQVGEALLDRCQGAVNEVGDGVLQYVLPHLDRVTVRGPDGDRFLGGQPDLAALHVQCELPSLGGRPRRSCRGPFEDEVVQPAVDLQTAQLGHSS